MENKVVFYALVLDIDIDNLLYIYVPVGLHVYLDVFFLFLIYVLWRIGKSFFLYKYSHSLFPFVGHLLVHLRSISIYEK